MDAPQTRRPRGRRVAVELAAPSLHDQRSDVSESGGNPICVKYVDIQTLRALDALVEAGVHTTRSEAAARLIVAGIQSNPTLFKRVYEAVAEIRRVREETQALARMWESGDASADAAQNGPESEAAQS